MCIAVQGTPNTYVEIVDSSEARKLRERRSTSSQASGSESVSGLILQAPASSATLSAGGSSTGSYAEVLDPTQTLTAAQAQAQAPCPAEAVAVAPQPYGIAEEAAGAYPDPDPSHQAIASQIAERERRLSQNLKSHPMSDQAKGGGDGDGDQTRRDTPAPEPPSTSPAASPSPERERAREHVHVHAKAKAKKGGVLGRIKMWLKA
jgi:hypothetical protein